ncbi:AAA family ATPase [Algoriphagus sp. PAP.12]|uniref:AAA family ATPase n=1 Tax=Algoriphagus sp. PAP.12 TaxID=2996678 RepID=UPI00227A05F0|nr:AAA family ATPase [Algoriphagus sp. PAP.12]
MESLLLRSQNKVRLVSLDFQRFLIDQIRWEERMIGILGARGAGKTTLLLQHLKRDLPKDGTSLYASLDDFYFSDHRLFDFAEEFNLKGGRYLLLDEIHKYPSWSRELKLIYDNLPELKIVFTSSSILEIYKGESDLSRRLVTYLLPELSFREFIQLETGQVFKSFKIQDLLKSHVEITSEILSEIKPIPLFQNYLPYGAYPYYIEGIDSFPEKLQKTLQLTLEVDINAVENMDFEMIFKLKKLINLISTSVPFTPNVSELARKSGISRPSLLRALDLLDRARIIQNLHKSNSGIGALTKPEKIYLNNSSLFYALAGNNAQIGTIRETFFANQTAIVSKVNLAERGDFVLDEKWVFEVGGKNKDQAQIHGIPDSYLVKDDIEMGVGNIIPLWLFGFLY